MPGPRVRWPNYPMPSNAIVREHPDSCVIETPPPTPQVLAEYRAAVKYDPQDAQLRLHYGHALQHSGDRDGAIRQFCEAVRLQPDEPCLLVTAGIAFRDAGDIDQAILVLRKALAAGERQASGADEQSEALARWSLSQALELKGEERAAREELRRAVELLLQGARFERASPFLLQQLQAELAEKGWS